MFHFPLCLAAQSRFIRLQRTSSPLDMHIGFRGRWYRRQFLRSCTGTHSPGSLITMEMHEWRFLAFFLLYIPSGDVGDEGLGYRFLPVSFSVLFLSSSNCRYCPGNARRAEGIEYAVMNGNNDHVLLVGANPAGTRVVSSLINVLMVFSSEGSCT